MPSCQYMNLDKISKSGITCLWTKQKVVLIVKDSTIKYNKKVIYKAFSLADVRDSIANTMLST